MPTREQELVRVRQIMGRPLENRPGNELIISGLIAEEQWMLNEAGLTGKGWSSNEATITTVDGTSDYTITPEAGHAFGRSLFAFRELDNDIKLPVPRTDYTSEMDNQRYEFVLSPPEGGEAPGWTGEKLAFYRDGASAKVRIFPVPDESGVVYKIIYATGALDWSTFAWADVPAFPEFAELRCSKVALSLLPDAEWDGVGPQSAASKRLERSVIAANTQKLWLPQFLAFIRNPNSETISEIDYWFN